MGIRIGWRGRLAAGAIAFMAFAVAFGATSGGVWLRAVLGWLVFVPSAWLALFGFPNALLPRRLREAEDIMKAPLVGKEGEGLSRWVIPLGQAVFVVLGLGLAALFAFAPIEFLYDYFGRRGLPRGLLESEGGILFARATVVVLGLFVGGFCAKSLWEEWPGRQAAFRTAKRDR